MNECRLIYWGLWTSYGDTDLDQYWLRWWIVAWQHEVITWSNVGLILTETVEGNSTENTQPNVY